jgi:hypothetical protein
LEKQQEDELKKRMIRKERSKMLNNNFLKLKSINNGMTRVVPGSLQQNITVERNFFKDLIKLSRQRYLSKLSSEFYMRRFLSVQSRKGLVSDRKFFSECINSNNNKVRTIKSAYSGHNCDNDIHNISISRLNNLKSLSALGAHLSSSESTINRKFEDMNNIFCNENDQQQRINKRPNTSIAYLNQFSKSVLNTKDITENFRSLNEMNLNKQTQLKLNLENKTNNHDVNLKPLIDSRYTNLFESMNEPYKKTENNLDLNINKDPSRRVNDIISTNKALQRPGLNSSYEREKKNLTQIELNKKLFEKLSTHSF